MQVVWRRVCARNRSRLLKLKAQMDAEEQAVNKS